MSGRKVAIVYYSMYGHVRKLADVVKEGIESTGIVVDLLQVPETLPAEVLEKMHAPEKPADIPIADPATLADYDGIVFGLPTRFGMAAAQMKSFMDATGSLWQSQALSGKPAGTIFSTASQGGGQETTAMTFVTQLTHHGMIYVPLGYSSPAMFNMEEIHGGSPWGPGTFAGVDGSRQPSDIEIEIARTYGVRFASIVTKLS